MGERDIDDDGGVDDEEDEDTCQVTISISLFTQLFRSEGVWINEASCLFIILIPVIRRGFNLLQINPILWGGARHG